MSKIYSVYTHFQNEMGQNLYPLSWHILFVAYISNTPPPPHPEYIYQQHLIKYYYPHLL